MSPGYRLHDERWPYLFNSYYEGEGERHARPRRGMLSRPSLDEVRDWRGAVDEALQRALPDLPAEALELVELGIHHEQQHQELFLTDILATFAENPLEPAYGELDRRALPRDRAAELGSTGREGLVEIGAPDDGFAFDCERPRHQALLHPHRIANRCVTNGEWAEFIADGGYRDADAVAERRLGLGPARRRSSAPLYWHDDGTHFTLAGRREIDRAAPVAHVSYYEADAFARWAGARLPTEAEWEDAFASADPTIGHQLDRAGAGRCPSPAAGLFGDVWQWTGAPSCPTPASRPRQARSANIMASS